MDIPKPLEGDYPLVKFWAWKSWKAELETEKDSSRGKANNRGSSTGLNIGMRYVEDGDGNPVDGTRAAAIRKFAKQCWQKVMDAKMAPRTWGAANLDVSRMYNLEMEAEFPELRFCDNHWKATAIATQYYPDWYGTAKPATVKAEPLPDDMNASAKRAYTPGSSPSKKRLKTRGREKKKQPDPPRLSPLGVEAVDSHS
jgi:hypothetical protein